MANWNKILTFFLTFFCRSSNVLIFNFILTKQFILYEKNYIFIAVFGMYNPDVS